jgi:hypothetical protein
MITKIHIVKDPDHKGYIGIRLDYEFEDVSLNKTAIAYLTKQQAIQFGQDISAFAQKELDKEEKNAFGFEKDSK